eukprot:8691637-Ditylum_brightwellii.AAC.1
MGVGFFHGDENAPSSFASHLLVSESSGFDNETASNNDTTLDIPMEKRGICFETWIKPNNTLSLEKSVNDDIKGTIFSMGKIHSANTVKDEEEESCNQFSGVQLHQRGDTFEFEFNHDYSLSSSCLKR